MTTYASLEPDSEGKVTLKVEPVRAWKCMLYIHEVCGKIIFLFVYEVLVRFNIGAIQILVDITGDPGSVMFKATRNE